ncbi:MAG: hypothetical protein ACTSQF_10885 [Candidatus Heimdallarchaeaceae archaeon]
MANQGSSGNSDYYRQLQQSRMREIGGMSHTRTGLRSPYDAEIQRHRAQAYNTRITTGAEKELQEQEKVEAEEDIYYLLSS